MRSRTYSVCRHCSKRAVTRPRGLCRKCFYAPGVIALYPSTSRHANRMPGVDFHGPGKEPTEPIPHLPGTAEKMKAMAERLVRGEELFHGEDARMGE